MQFNQPFYQGEAQAKPAPCPVKALVRLAECLKHMRQHFRSDPDPGVADGDGRLLGFRFRADPNKYLVARTAKLGRVLQQVAKDLGEAYAIAPDPERPFKRLKGKNQTRALQASSVVLDGHRD